MASHLEIIYAEVPREAVRATAAASSGAVAVTDDDLIIAKSGFLGFGKKLTRYPLAGLQKIHLSPNPHSDLLSLEFHETGGLTLMFGPSAKSDVARLTEVLSARLGSNGNGNGRQG